jgi:hypothetical protein
VDVSQWPAAAPDNDHLTALESEFGMHAQALADQKTTAETEEAQAKTGEAKATAQAAKFKEVNGTLFDVSGAQPKVATPQGMEPDKWLKLVDQIVPDNGENHALNLRTKHVVGFYIAQGNQKAAQDEITKAGQQLGAIEKDVAENTNPAIQARKAEARDRDESDGAGDRRRRPESRGEIARRWHRRTLAAGLFAQAGICAAGIQRSRTIATGLDRN